MALNFMNDIDDTRVQATFGSQKYQRLVDLKQRWDPTNMFAINQNIRPDPTHGVTRDTALVALAKPRTFRERLTRGQPVS